MNKFFRGESAFEMQTKTVSLTFLHIYIKRRGSYLLRYNMNFVSRISPQQNLFQKYLPDNYGALPLSQENNLSLIIS